ncbi:DUF1214 domain-containing protein [Streptomyces sp. NPDC006012]|uniref:DUF1214 domain-containing protein n=1 Tax=Streptomyces sp. NPDC006012 TaxID=3364739 RepID=UPI003687FFFF
MLDSWQRPVADLGQTGPDQGRGGGYVVLGPGHDDAPFKDCGRYAVRSHRQLRFNDAGNTDLFIGPTAPDGTKSNWLKTVAPDGWFVYFRLYAPTEPFFDRTWALPDLEALA